MTRASRRYCLILSLNTSEDCVSFLISKYILQPLTAPHTSEDIVVISSSRGIIDQSWPSTAQSLPPLNWEGQRPAISTISSNRLLQHLLLRNIHREQSTSRLGPSPPSNRYLCPPWRVAPEPRYLSLWTKAPTRNHQCLSKIRAQSHRLSPRRLAHSPGEIACDVARLY